MLVWYAIFLPYKRYIPIDIRIFTLPEIINIYASNNGIVSVKCCDITDVRDSLLLGYFVDKENITPILANSQGRLLRNVTNEEYVFSADLLFSIIPDIECVYGKFEIVSHDYLSLDPGKKYG
ncbi:MAG: hypothetical protein LIP04_10995 [Tannerellaceae bacterium]|nr:hypothetical protein [Tannerellaceae bacterium]